MKCQLSFETWEKGAGEQRGSVANLGEMEFESKDPYPLPSAGDIVTLKQGGAMKKYTVVIRDYQYGDGTCTITCVVKKSNKAVKGKSGKRISLSGLQRKQRQKRSR